MTLPTGTISMSQVNTELGYASTATISLNDAAVRSLAGVPSGAISMSNLQGKSNTFLFTISTNQTNANLRTLAVNAGWNQSSKVIATISSGVNISSNNTGIPAMTVNGSFPNGVELANNGFIVGMGGKGGNGNGAAAPNVGSAGGTALSVSVGITINNAGTIAGGGGGGGGGRRNEITDQYIGVVPRNGGGGGGGRSSAAANSAGGSAAPQNTSPLDARAGSAGTYSAAGVGGQGDAPGYAAYGGTGGTGGNWGATGSTGGVGNVGYPGVGPSVGGSGGNSVSGNSNITWSATGTRIGGIA